MDVVTLIEQVLTKFLTYTQLPTLVQSVIMDLVKKILTPELVAKLEKEMSCYVCAQIKAMAKASPANQIDDAVAEIVCKALGGDQGCA